MFRTMGERAAVRSSRRTGRRTNRPGSTDSRRFDSLSAGGLIDDWAGKIGEAGRSTADWAAGWRQREEEIRRQAAQPAAGRRTVHLGIDVPLMLVVVTLLIFGLLMVYSASYDYSLTWFADSGFVFSRQVMWLALGVPMMIFLALFDYHRLQKLIVPAMVVTVVLLIAVLIINEVRNGAVRTLLGGSVQPSELAKLVTVIYVAVWLFSKRDQLSQVSFGLVPLAAGLGFVGGLIFIQPDLSAAMTIIFLGGVMFFLAGGDLKQIGLLLVGALAVGFLVVQFHATGAERLADYLAGIKDPIQGSYHVRRALEAFVNGGWFGAGIGRSTTKLTGLPVPPTDSIFAVIGEETGVMGAFLTVGLYLIFLWRGLFIARRAPDDLGSFLAAGLSLWISVEAFVNMAVMVNLVPFAGNALPFVSAGGSNLIVSLAAVGILLNISRRSVMTSEDSGRFFHAVVDLRRRDGRRRVSRAERPAGAKR